MDEDYEWTDPYEGLTEEEILKIEDEGIELMSPWEEEIEDDEEVEEDHVEYLSLIAKLRQMSAANPRHPRTSL